MRRITTLGLFLAAATGVLVAGCAKKSEPSAAATTTTPSTPNATPGAPGGGGAGTAQPADHLAIPTPEIPKQEKYDTALLQAVNHLADRKFAEALISLETAKAIDDTEQVRQEIARVKLRMEQQAAAEQTVRDIQIVLNDGKPEEAARLATAGLDQFGGTDAADQLAKLKRQADALAGAQLADQNARRTKFRADADAALRDKNLRAAAIALESALQAGEDPTLRQQHEQVRASLAKYDDSRRKAGELRRDPYQLEDAIALYEQAAQAWDTLQVRQELNECRLALQKRRDRISVADFEIRGDVGIPGAGRTIAEELLPAFKARFDLVERSQLTKVIAELKLESSDLAENEGGRRQIGELAKIRYLVLGSVTRMSGALISARVVDVRTGLVVQTAKLSAASPEELLGRLPQLATLLMMSDDQRIAYEQQLAQQAPPSPLAAAGGLIAYSPRPPDLGGVRVEDFDRLPPLPPNGTAPAVAIDLALPLKNKFLGVSVELGDDLFKRGRFTDAIRHFEFALALHPDREDLRIKLDQCRPHVPPSPPIAIGGPRPRLAIVNFVTAGDPVVVPPGLGAWTAENIAPYLSPPYEVVDRGEVFWWMGRLGLTVRDLVEDPAARRYLARAMNVRFFLLGTIRQTASFDVSTHLLDAEYGFRVGGTRLHVHHTQELKFRLGELARLTLMDPRERDRFEAESREYDRLLVEGRQRFERGEFSIAIELFGKARKNRPFSVEVQVLVDQSEVRARQAALEEARRRELDRAAVIAAEARRRQIELQREAEAARIRAEQEAAALAAAGRRFQEEQRRRAQEQLLSQARIALQGKNFSLSIQLFDSAAGLHPSDDVFRELAQAKARAAEEARVAAQAEQARREAELRRQREAQLVQARLQLEEARKQREAEEKARLAAQETRDKAEYTRLLDEAQRLQATQKYDQAVAALQTARQLRKTDEVERLLQSALIEQARATAAKKDAVARAELEKKLASEKSRREAAEAEAKKNKDLYEAALQLAQKAAAEKRYDVAVAKYNEAGKIFKTDAVVAGLRQVEEARAQETATRDAILRREAEAARREADFKKAMTEGQTALVAKQYAKAVASFKQATELKPGDVEALAALSKAEQARQDVLAARAAETKKAEAAAAAEAERKKQEQARLDAKKQAEELKQQAEFSRLMSLGAAAMNNKRYEDAVKAYGDALKIRPDDVTARSAYQSATLAFEASKVKTPPARTDPPVKTDPPVRPPVTPSSKTDPLKQTPPKSDLQTRPMPPMKTDPARPPTPPKTSAEYTTQMTAGARAEQERKFGEAVVAYSEALRLAPGDAKAAAALRSAQFKLYMDEGQKAMTAKRYPRAVNQFDAALKLFPESKEAAQALDQAKKAKP
jgi:tetratricopeptide (TPR) repeat protein